VICITLYEDNVENVFIGVLTLSFWFASLTSSMFSIVESMRSAVKPSDLCCRNASTPVLYASRICPASKTNQTFQTATKIRMLHKVKDGVILQPDETHSFNALILNEQRTIIQQCVDWYTGRWWVGCYIWYSEEGPGRAGVPPNPLLAEPNVTAHSSTASVPTSYYLMWHYNCLWTMKG